MLYQLKVVKGHWWYFQARHGYKPFGGSITFGNWREKYVSVILREGKTWGFPVNWSQPNPAMLGAKCTLALSTDEAQQVNCLSNLDLDATALVQDGHLVRYGLSPNPYFVQFYALGDISVNDDDDPPAGEVMADITLHSPPRPPLPLKTSLDLGIFLFLF